MSDLRQHIQQASGNPETFKDFQLRFYEPTCFTNTLGTIVPAPGAGKRIILTGIVASGALEFAGTTERLFFGDNNTEFLTLAYAEATGILIQPIPLLENQPLKRRCETGIISNLTVFYKIKDL